MEVFIHCFMFLWVKLESGEEKGGGGAKGGRNWWREGREGGGRIEK